MIQKFPELFDVDVYRKNIVLPNVAIGMFAQPNFTLTFPHIVAIIAGFGIMCADIIIRSQSFHSLTISTSGSVPVGFVATLGPLLGMHTMIITRYSFGY